MKSLGIGIIGCGVIMSAHVNGIIEKDLGHIVMFCDCDASLAKNAASLYGGEYCTDYMDVLNNDDQGLRRLSWCQSVRYLV